MTSASVDRSKAEQQIILSFSSLGSDTSEQS